MILKFFHEIVLIVASLESGPWVRNTQQRLLLSLLHLITTLRKEKFSVDCVFF